MSKRRRKKKNPLFTVLKVFIIVMIIVIIGMFSYSKIKKAAETKLTEIAINQVIKQQTGEDVDVQKVIDQMSEEDAQTANELIDKYATDDTISDVVSEYQSGDMSAVESYLKENVDSSDVDQLTELYEKYKDSVE